MGLLMENLSVAELFEKALVSDDERGQIISVLHHKTDGDGFNILTCFVFRFGSLVRWRHRHLYANGDVENRF